MTEPAAESPTAIAARQGWMRVLARAGLDELAGALAACPALPDHLVLRGPQTGLVMLRGRAGGGGAAFNLGEMTVTRCTVRSAGGQIGHASIAGRDGARAELAARIDAALQDPSLHEVFTARLVAPLRAAQEARTAADARRAAATQVQFFTMATMRS
ncbi:MAG: phosphonate C-P lyase system protein PhnG [Rhodospirillales bacterium]|nr:phosphonate C-P lyase system protein PhnG [Rhodospirillales bacterium]MDE2197611.1 phosphonate C-P lyase system protein PhnG [Rhodospirillales bacterium]MDE2574772.1 phosphonate C-P lyase system protein PhnG [Rhodospirillales bacterium]